MNKIMVVDDDINIRELVSTILQNEGFEVCRAKDGLEALNLLGKEKINLCVLDIMMPGMDGFEFCRNARRYYKDMPILMLTAKGDISQKVKGFEMGTDDYLTKPFEAAELIVRVRALLKRYKIASSQIVQIGELTLDRNRFAALIGKEETDIPMKEFELLFKLGSYPGKTIPRDQLIEDVWGFEFDGNERTLDVHINRLRDRFPTEMVRFRIVTVRGLGYRLEVTP
jgi:Response regulators consisting of a CheY-like receiver domain and a winged-helix DNA-binding domain